MAADPYDLLGVKRDASQKDIQKAYRQKAKKLHPDLNPGDKSAEQSFKEVSAAYELLSDADKRKRFDAGEIDASGEEKPRQRYYRDFADAETANNSYRSSAGFSDFGDADIFADLFGRGGGRGAFRARGADIRYRLGVDFLDAINGATKQVTLADGSTVDLVIPPGTRDGQVFRLNGKGANGGDGEPGDALVEIHVRPHPFFVRDGDHIRFDLPISLSEAVQGGKVRVPTPTGPVTATVPQWSNTGRVLRLRGKGAPRRTGARGDAYATLKVMLPERPDPDLEKFVANWPAGARQRPRRAMGV